MENFVPPWDQTAWILFHADSFLQNVDASSPVDAVLDLRSPFLARVVPYFASQLKRRGVGGVMVDALLDEFLTAEFLEGWEVFFPPPFSSFRLVQAARAGFIPVLSQLPEAIHLSNQSQAVSRALPYAVRLRGADLMADQGPASPLSLLEALPTLPGLAFQGFLLDEPFRTRPACEAFARAVGRVFPSARVLKLMSPVETLIPSRFSRRSILGPELLGLSSGQGAAASVSLQAWGTPVAVRERDILVQVDIGWEHHLPADMGSSVFVENTPGLIRAVEARRTLIELRTRPAKAGPWVVTLVGDLAVPSGGTPVWPYPGIRKAIECLAGLFPVFVRPEQEWINLRELAG
jgi:hypothetical protein